jgi:formylglycine-generating enzyme required for sulfatase activity/tRNA A-37 threonylcarbamoyl transferase component Bud32
MPAPHADDSPRTTDHAPAPESEARTEAQRIEASPHREGGATPSYLTGQATATFQPNPAAELRAGSRAAPSEPPLPSIPGYVIEAVLGRGGMGVVYKARHQSLKRTVALKMVLGGGRAGPRELARFRIEAEAIARLQHPNIVQIYEVGEAGGHPYCALEFVEGGNLAGKLDGPGAPGLPAREAAQLVESLARAMQLAHSRNVLHRDLKPANILLTADGTPKIADFGLARHLDSHSGETLTGAVIGTPSYLAPEQASGHAHEAGPPADVYALGAILYQCLAGRPPFRGKTVAETLDQVRTQEPAPPSLGGQRVPLDLQAICLKCLRKDPEKRYASAAELADDLARYRQGEPILARPVGRLERAAKWVKRNPVVAGAALAVLLALAGGATVSTLKYLDAQEQKGIAQGKEQEARAEAAKAQRARAFLVSIFELSDSQGQRGTMTARQILDDAEKSIPQKFADQPELQKELQADVERVLARITADAPLAMILEVRGTVQLQSARNPAERAVPQALLYGGDRLSLATDGQVQLVILSDLHKEWLKGGREATVLRRGCEPADAVQERDPSPVWTFVRLPKGTFYMGWNGQKKGVKTEILEDFEIAAHDVTQGQWEAVMGYNPSSFARVQGIANEECKLLPVEMVSWDDVQEFLKKLNQSEQKRGGRYLYRLPSEAEWEYACRGGATSEEECSYHFYFDKPTNHLSSRMANFNGTEPFGNADKGPFLERPTRVGAYPPNKLGLYDMHGNVWQLTSPQGDAVRVVRGGGWFTGGAYCRAGHRSNGAPQGKFNHIGFRLARVPRG